MSKGLSYFLGIVTGILLTFGFFAVRAYTAKQGGEGDTKTEKQAKLPDGVTMLDTPVPFTEAKTSRSCRSYLKTPPLPSPRREWSTPAPSITPTLWS